MRRRLLARQGLACGLFACAFVLGAPLRPAHSADSLTVKEQRELAEVAQAYFRGDSGTVIRSLSAMLTRLKDEQLEQVDQQLKSRELPPLGKLLGAARINAVAQGVEKSLPPVSAREAVLILPEFQAELDAVFEHVAKEPVMAETLIAPETVEGYEPLLWNAHVLENKLANTQRFVQYMLATVKRVPRAQIAKLNEEDKKILEADYGELQKRVTALARDVEEREAELRLRRLERARAALAEPELSKEKWLAASAWYVDATILNDFFKELPKNQKPGRESLQAATLPKQIEKLAGECSKLAGDLTLKANLLTMGIHWWLRGRYGEGTEFFGLAKHEAVMRQPRGEFYLYMPTTPPKPTDPSRLATRERPVPTYDRRHHYWWAWEDRRVIRDSLHRNDTQIVATSTVREGTGKRQEVKLSRFI